MLVGLKSLKLVKIRRILLLCIVGVKYSKLLKDNTKSLHSVFKYTFTAALYISRASESVLFD